MVKSSFIGALILAVVVPVLSQEPKWVQLAKWSGSGMKETETFSTTQREWRISWELKAQASVGGTFYVSVHRASDEELVSRLSGKPGAGKEASYVRTTPGKYYLKVNSANVEWTIIAEEQR